MFNNSDNLQVNIIYSNRKTIAIEVNMDGVLVRAPKGMSRREIKAFLNEKRSWIEALRRNAGAKACLRAASTIHGGGNENPGPKGKGYHSGES